MQRDRRSHLVGLIGAGIGPSLTPELHERAAQHLGLRYVYRTVEAAAPGQDVDDIGALIATAGRFGYDGLNITHPCKRTAPKHLDRLSPEAALLGAVNTVLFDANGRTTGHNTDGSGFARSFARGLPGVALCSVVLVGAGGAGAAVAHALLGLGTEQLTIIDTDAARARDLATTLRVHSGKGADLVTDAELRDLPRLLDRADGLVNTTPMGMADHPGSPVPAALLDPDTWVADVVYRPALTPLLAQAAERGCRTLDGSGMAVFQAAEAFRLITGIDPDTERMLDDMAALLAPSTTH